MVALESNINMYEMECNRMLKYNIMLCTCLVVLSGAAADVASRRDEEVAFARRDQECNLGNYFTDSGTLTSDTIIVIIIIRTNKSKSHQNLPFDVKM
jgi:hypothetical protein